MNAMTSRRIIAVLLLSFASGLPLSLTASTLQAWYTVSGVDLMTIGALSLVGLPYIWKFLWAPFFDRYFSTYFGRRRGWIMFFQLGLVVTLAYIAVLNPAEKPWAVAVLALVIAFFSASQDIVIDAYRVDVLKPEERGLGSSVTAIGARLAMLVSGALALILAKEIGFRATYLIMALIMLFEILVTYWSPEPENHIEAPHTFIEAVVEPFKEFMSRHYAIWLIVFIIIYKLCDAFALALNTTFLLRGVHFSLVDVGSIGKITGVIGTLLGSLVGGLYYKRLGLYRSLMYFGFLQMSSNLLFAALAAVGKNYTLMAFSMFGDYFCGGLSTVAFIAFLIGLCDRRFSAAQYALLSAVMAIGRVFVGPAAAAMVGHMGWVNFYIVTFFIGFPSLLLLWWLNRKIDFSARQLAS